MEHHLSKFAFLGALLIEKRPLILNCNIIHNSCKQNSHLETAGTCDTFRNTTTTQSVVFASSLTQIKSSAVLLDAVGTFLILMSLDMGFICPGLGDDVQWSEPRPRHVREPKTRAQEETLQVTCNLSLGIPYLGL